MIENLFQIGEPRGAPRDRHRAALPATRPDCRVPHARPGAAASGLRIRETSESGSVPELAVENPLAERVLLYDGEELVGAKQNRILNVSVLVEAKSTLTIPVSCVEQGRWRHVSPEFEGGGSISHAQLRRRKAETQAAQPLARGVAQSEVWDELHEKSFRMSRRLSDGRERGSLPCARARPALTRGRLPCPAGAVRRDLRDRARRVPGRRLPTGRLRAAVAEAQGRVPARRARAARRKADVR